EPHRHPHHRRRLQRWRHLSDGGGANGLRAGNPGLSHSRRPRVRRPARLSGSLPGGDRPPRPSTVPRGPHPHRPEALGGDRSRNPGQFLPGNRPGLAGGKPAGRAGDPGEDRVGRGAAAGGIRGPLRVVSLPRHPHPASGGPALGHLDEEVSVSFAALALSLWGLELRLAHPERWPYLAGACVALALAVWELARQKRARTRLAGTEELRRRIVTGLS